MKEPPTAKSLLKTVLDSTPDNLKAINAVVLLTNEDGEVAFQFKGLRPKDETMHRDQLLQLLLRAVHMVAMGK